MQGKVIFEVTTGTQAGKRYEYDQAERIFVGRQEDCDIVLPVDTVSRYHCLLSINPPIAKLQDFGSLNGTLINDRKIGQREKNQSPEEGRNAEYTAYELHDGDRIRLGKSCEIKCSIEQPRIQSIPVSEEQPASEGTIPEPEPLTPPKSQTPQAPSTSVHAPKKKKCSGCGKSFTPVAEDNNLCPNCLLDQGKLLDAILAKFSVKRTGMSIWKHPLWKASTR